VDPARDVPHLGDRVLGGGVGVVDELAGGLRVLPEPLPGHPEVHGDRHEPLLGAVVEVALDPAALGLDGVDRLDPRLREGLDPP
jgi:hypothetical protein